MSCVQFRFAARFFLALLLFTLHSSLFTVHAALGQYDDSLPIVYLQGSPYELGRQHGEQLRDRVRAAVAQLLGYFRGYVKIPWVGPRLVDWWLDRPWEQAAPFIPQDYLEELRGLSEGSGVSLRDLCRLHAIPDRTYACSSFAAWSLATKDGRLVHARNLDWNIDAGIQRHAMVFVVRPSGKQAFVNVGWAGFIGVLTGVNAAQLSVAQIGAETVDVSPKGLPMVFVIRRVLEEASTVEEAVALMQRVPRTVGINYVVADANARRAVAIETTARDLAVFEANDRREQDVDYAKPMLDVVLRADTAIDPRIRARQLASKGDPARPGLERPGGSAYEVRYLGQAEAISAHYGRMDAEGAIAVAKSAAPPSNIQSVVVAWPDLWVANAQGDTRAAHTRYQRLDLEQLFSR